MTIASSRNNRFYNFPHHYARRDCIRALSTFTEVLHSATPREGKHAQGRCSNGGQSFTAYSKEPSDQTIWGIHTAFHAAPNKAAEEKLILHNSSDRCKLLPATQREMQVLTPAEIHRPPIQAKEDGCYELLLLALSTGLRRGEICALKWDNLNFKTGILKIDRQVHRVEGELIVFQPKTKSSNRSVVLPAPVLAVLKDYEQSAHSQ